MNRMCLHVYVHISVCVCRAIYQLTQLWRLTSPKMCSRQAGDPGGQWCGVVPVNTSRLKTTKEQMFHFKSKVKKEWSPSSRSQAGGVLPFSLQG